VVNISAAAPGAAALAVPAPAPSVANLSFSDLIGRAAAAAPTAAPAATAPPGGFYDAAQPAGGFAKIGTAFFGGRHRSQARPCPCSYTGSPACCAAQGRRRRGRGARGRLRRSRLWPGGDRWAWLVRQAWLSL